MRFPCIAFVAIQLAGIAICQTPQLVADINQVPRVRSSEPDGFVRIGVETFFTARTARSGRQVFRTLGVSSTTKQVTNLPNGVVRVDPCALGTKLFFVANTSSRPGLHVIDTSATNPVPTLLTTAFCCDFLQAFRGHVYFRGGGLGTGIELWRSDGTVRNTGLFRDLDPGPASSYPEKAIVVGSRMYFLARTQATHQELAVTDGTSAGTGILDVLPGAKSSQPGHLTVFGGQLYFAANHASLGRELFRVSGTAVRLALDVYPGARSGNPSDLLVFKNQLYFAGDHVTLGRELFRFNGTTATVFDLAKGILSSSPRPMAVAGTGSTARLVGTAYQVGSGVEPWAFDGSSHTFVDVSPGTASSRASGFTAAPNGLVLFQAHSSVAVGTELWATDGTRSGTRLVRDIEPAAYRSSDPRGFFVTATGPVLFSASNLKNGIELWATDGSTARTTLVTDINAAPATADARIESMLEAHGRLYFTAKDGRSGRELWTSDGTPTGTRRVADLLPGAAGSEPSQLTVVGRKLFFHAKTNSGNAPCVLDLVTGRVTILNVRPGSGRWPNVFVAYKGRCYFAAAAATYGMELWSSDGTIAGTRMVRDIEVGSGSSYPKELTVHAGALYFTATTRTGGLEVWTSDGTARGTRQLKDLHAGAGSSYPVFLSSVGGWLVFSAYVPGVGRELVVSDGTSAGTRMLDIERGARSSNPGPTFVAMGNRIVFGATTLTVGRELHAFDGTRVAMLRDINGGRANSLVSAAGGLVSLGSRVVFSAFTGPNNWGLWVTDGSTRGTVRLTDLSPGWSTRPAMGLCGKRRVFFRATQTTSDSELWVTDGTRAGTRRFADLYPGPLGSSPEQLTLVRDRMYFVANDLNAGRELFKLDLDGLSNRVGRGCRAGGVAPELDADDPVLGARATLRVQRGVTNANGAVLVGLPTNARTVAALGSGCTIHVNLGGPTMTVPFRTSATGVASWSAVVPNNPSSIGVQLMLQAGIGPTPTGPLGLDLTNGLLLDFGR